MKKIILYTCLLATLLLGGSCTKSTIDGYHGDEYIQFQDSLINFSFAFIPGQEHTDIAIPFRLIGFLSEQDREVNITAAFSSTAGSAKDYEVLSTKLRANRINDSVFVRIHKSELLDTQELRLTLTIGSNEYFSPGPDIGVKSTLSFSNMLMQPEWWDKNITKNYLGDYSESKYRHFIIATGISAMPKEMSGSEKRAYAIQFKNYIRKNSIIDDNGLPMEVPVK